jgi:hypothetical protein
MESDQANGGPSPLLSGAALRSWWALSSQKRRRNWRNQTPAAPVIGSHSEDFSVGPWIDVVLGFTFEQGAFPDGSMELYLALASGGWVWNYAATFDSSLRSYRHVNALNPNLDENVRYKMRYRLGSEVIGPFSDVYEFEFVAP